MHWSAARDEEARNLALPGSIIFPFLLWLKRKSSGARGGRPPIVFDMLGVLGVFYGGRDLPLAGFTGRWGLDLARGPMPMFP